MPGSVVPSFPGERKQRDRSPFPSQAFANKLKAEQHSHQRHGSKQSEIGVQGLCSGLTENACPKYRCRAYKSIKQEI